MIYKSLILSLSLFTFLSTQAEATEEILRDIAEENGVKVTPKKTALYRLAREGVGALASIKEEQENAKRHKHQEEAEAQRRIAQLKEQAQKEQHQREKEEHLAKERAERDRQIAILKREQEEKLERERAEQVRQFEILKRENEEQIERGRVASERQLEIMKREAVELRERERLESERRLAEAQRERLVVGDVGNLQAKLEAMEQERNLLLGQLTVLLGGQAHMPSEKTQFITYGDSYVHSHNLRAPDTTLDAELHQNLSVIQDNIAALLAKVPGLGSLTSIKKKMLKLQLERLLGGVVENFEASIFLKAFQDVQVHITPVINEKEFKTIEELVGWLMANRTSLSKVGEHQVYFQRQNEAAKLVQERTIEFEEFYEDYLDRVVADMCVWLSPTHADGDGVRNTKLEFRLKLQTSSIPVLRNYLGGTIKIFGTTDNFLNNTFISSGKGSEYEEFKQVLQSYSALFRDLGEHQKLVEEILNYQFFQKRYRFSVLAIQDENLNDIQDGNIRSIVEKMRDKDVLSYEETNSAIFAASIPEALKDYITKVAIRPGENLLGVHVEKLLIAYSQIHAFSNSLRVGNPKVTEFHE